MKTRPLAWGLLLSIGLTAPSCADSHESGRRSDAAPDATHDAGRADAGLIPCGLPDCWSDCCDDGTGGVSYCCAYSRRTDGRFYCGEYPACVGNFECCAVPEAARRVGPCVDVATFERECVHP